MQKFRLCHVGFRCYDSTLYEMSTARGTEQDVRHDHHMAPANWHSSIIYVDLSKRGGPCGAMSALKLKWEQMLLDEIFLTVDYRQLILTHPIKQPLTLSLTTCHYIIISYFFAPPKLPVFFLFADLFLTNAFQYFIISSVLTGFQFHSQPAAKK